MEDFLFLFNFRTNSNNVHRSTRNTEELAGQIKANEFLFEEESQTFDYLTLQKFGDFILPGKKFTIHNFHFFLISCKQLCANI